MATYVTRACGWALLGEPRAPTRWHYGTADDVRLDEVTRGVVCRFGLLAGSCRWQPTWPCVGRVAVVVPDVFVGLAAEAVVIGLRDELRAGREDLIAFRAASNHVLSASELPTMPVVGSTA